MNKDEYFALLNSIKDISGNYEQGEIEVIKDINIISKFEQETGQIVGILTSSSRYVLLNDCVKFSNGKMGIYFRFLTRGTIEGNIGAVVLPILPNGSFVLNIIYRHATRNDDPDSGWRIEAPRGCGYAGELACETALRELKEEQGYTINTKTDVIHLGYCDPDSGMTGGKVATYAVYIKNQVGDLNHDDGESGIQTVCLPKLQLMNVIKNGSMKIIIHGLEKIAYLRDGFLLSALMQLEAHTITRLPK